jgi:transcriptional regulator with XRE-family HTH domain
VEYINHPDFLFKVGKRVKELREAKGISQYELSYITEISRNQIGRIERGEINTSLSSIFEISIGLEIDVQEFFKFENLEE